MRICDIITARGQVSPYFIDLTSGRRMAWDDRHNTISYEASFAMASAFGGDPSYIPNKIGIIYGASADPQFAQIIDRDQSWADLQAELESKNADVQVQSFSSTPTLKRVYKEIGQESGSVDSSDSGESSVDRIPGYAVTFHAHSDSTTPGAFGTYYDEAKSAQGQIFTNDTYIYQAVLLNHINGKYRILARASLIDGTTYRMKPENFEVALDWTIKFF